ncbi:low molecular weight protein-tyrosine-phosphatase [Geitlerinema sp. PCC 9228]|jgi:protein-tyrosine phosphatase|uniref:low molecular weight protein-tyrosine-phosphatase n=1 Tax=Geitlerinema sp. PCC 9228 TaxID=111611 RepID=UPI0008F99346|nr:low molecular weight protein-tyrosine-phosphatase [Geitlerinema sp. PCC 9228]
MSNSLVQPTPTTNPYGILFVCLGNICRSPAAENITNYLLRERQLSDRIFCDSAGVLDYHTGKSPDPRMVFAANRRGIPISGKARPVGEADLQAFDLIVAMDRENYEFLLSLDRRGEYRGKIRMMCDFCRDRSRREVPDPYYGGPDGFDLVIDLLWDASNGLLDYLMATEPVLASSPLEGLGNSI